LRGNPAIVVLFPQEGSSSPNFGLFRCLLPLGGLLFPLRLNLEVSGEMDRLWQHYTLGGHQLFPHVLGQPPFPKSCCFLDSSLSLHIHENLFSSGIFSASVFPIADGLMASNHFDSNLFSLVPTVSTHFFHAFARLRHPFFRVF